MSLLFGVLEIRVTKTTRHCAVATGWGVPRPLARPFNNNWKISTDAEYEWQLLFREGERDTLRYFGDICHAFIAARVVLECLQECCRKHACLVFNFDRPHVRQRCGDHKNSDTTGIRTKPSL